nr:MAG TPA: hypothetical protein [Caudoviricetes sp.]
MSIFFRSLMGLFLLRILLSHLLTFQQKRRIVFL